MVPFPGEGAGRKRLMERNQLDAVYRIGKMYRLTKYMPGEPFPIGDEGHKNLLIFYDSETGFRTSIP
jgi:hypothetical protein